MYIGLGLLASVVYYFMLKTENTRRDRGMRDEIIDGVNDNGVFVRCSPLTPRHRPICLCNVGDLETVERLARLNGRFATVENAKGEKGDDWSGYRYTL